LNTIFIDLRARKASDPIFDTTEEYHQ